MAETTITGIFKIKTNLLHSPATVLNKLNAVLNALYQKVLAANVFNLPKFLNNTQLEWHTMERIYPP